MERGGEPSAALRAGSTDARLLDRGSPKTKPRSCGNQPAYESLLNRRLQLRLLPWASPNISVWAQPGPSDSTRVLTTNMRERDAQNMHLALAAIEAAAKQAEPAPGEGKISRRSPRRCNPAPARCNGQPRRGNGQLPPRSMVAGIWPDSPPKPRLFAQFCLG